MRYSVYFFLADPTRIKALLADPTAPDQVVTHLKSKRRLAGQEDCERVAETIRLLQDDALGSSAETYRFESLLWALDLVGEPIELATLVNFNRYSYFSDAAMVPLLRSYTPPIAVPRASCPPEVLYLPHASFAQTMDSIRESCALDECRAAEEELADVLESALSESLDLWGIAID